MTDDMQCERRVAVLRYDVDWNSLASLDNRGNLQTNPRSSHESSQIAGQPSEYLCDNRIRRLQHGVTLRHEHRWPFVNPFGWMSRRSRHRAITGLVHSLATTNRLDLAIEKKSRLACWLIDALDHEGLIFRIFFDGACNLGMERQCFGDIILVDVWQVTPGKIAQFSVSDIEALISRQELIDGRKAPRELVYRHADWAKPQK